MSLSIDHLRAGQVIPAHPLALTEGRKLSERHQQALTRYYIAAGAGGIAVGVHSTQFEIREPRHGLFRPVMELAALTADEEIARSPRPFVKVAGLCGETAQAQQEASMARELGYNAGLLSMTAVQRESEPAILAHVREVGQIMPLIGFYLQNAVGGRRFSRAFWREFAAIPAVVAIKIAPFDRYQTLELIRGVAESGRVDLALYTGNDDTIVTDLLTDFSFDPTHPRPPVVIRGGLLGHWGVWTRASVQLFARIQEARKSTTLSRDWLSEAVAVTDMNAAVFDPAHDFAGCIPGILEVLRRQGLVPTAHCLNPAEVLSPGQAEELTRVTRAYPHLIDDDFIAEHRAAWLR